MISKTRNIGLILWTDNKLHMDALRFIKQNYTHYIYVLHDKDFNEDKQPQKAHYHVLLHFPNQKLISALKKDLNINDTDIYFIRSLPSQLRYLIHLDDEDKFQYSESEVYGSRFMIYKFHKAIKNINSEEEEITLLLNYLDISDNIKIIDILQFALDNEIYGTFRRNYSIIKDILKKR